MEPNYRVLKSEGHMSPITHLNDLFMQINWVVMVTVKHVTICAEIFSDAWDWKKSQTAPHGTAAINANVRIFILWSVGAVATVLFTGTIIMWFCTIKTSFRQGGDCCLCLSSNSLCKCLQERAWGALRRCVTHCCAALVHCSSIGTRFDLGTELCGDTFIALNLEDHNKMWDRLVLTIWHFPELLDTSRCRNKFLTVSIYQVCLKKWQNV